MGAIFNMFLGMFVYGQKALLSVMFSWAFAFGINAIVGTESYSAPLGDRLGPSAVWWMVLAGIGLAMTYFLAFLRGERPFASDIDEKKPENTNALTGVLIPVGAGVFLFWLWLHDAYALLWPALAFTAVCGAMAGITWGISAEGSVAVPAGPPAPGGQAGRDRNQLTNIAVRARYTFADVDGMGSLKHELLAFGKEALVTDKQAAAIRKSTPEKTFRNGALFFGDPGNGKTFMAEALAGSLGIPIIAVSIAKLQSMWVGQTTERVVEVFANAVSQAPCMLFLDEIDAILGDRGAMNDPNSEVPKIVNAMLTELTNIRGKGIVVVAATNYPDKLDAAGRREGRFDVKIEIPAPDFDARLGILRRSLGTGAQIRPGTLEMAAKHFAGFSVSRLMAVGNLVRDRIDRLDPDDKKREVRFGTLLSALRKIQGVTNAGLREGVMSLEEVVLKPQAKAEILRLAAMMKDIEGTERAGGAIQPGVVFYGPPGTGKTLVAKALAKATGWTFIPTTGQDLVRSEDAMDKVMAKASDLRPSIVFIDEADDILADRNYSPHTKMATNKLLTLLDGASGRVPDVIFVAATNNPATFDGASKRRFPIKIEFALPGPAEIDDYVGRWMDGLSVPLENTFSQERAVKLLEGKSIADIKVALQEAVNIAVSHRLTEPHRGLRLGDLAKAVRSLSFGD
ncbi:MAG: ATP-binding protein [Pseudomonadota bacterium]|jgi:transitional endoplasmic reticulum ATPase